MIEDVYEDEMNYGDWNENMVPFYGIGNGDYFCMNTKEGENSRVYYYYHESGEYDVYSANFEEWIRGLSDFLQ